MFFAHTQFDRGCGEFTLRFGASFLSFATVVGFGATLILSSYLRGASEIESAWNSFRQRKITYNHSEAVRAKGNIENIYNNIRTIALLPSLRNLDRYASNITDDGRSTIQQIYNNLVNKVNISEVYIVPANFNPTRLDPNTGKLEEPSLMFDQLVINDGKFAKESDPFAKSYAQSQVKPLVGEIETEEYRELYNQIQQLKKSFDHSSKIDGLRVPFISSPKVMTCDNTEFYITHKEGDRDGTMISVPFYAMDGKFAGLVSAIVRINALSHLVDGNGQVISGPNGVFATGEIDRNWENSASWKPNFFRANEEKRFVADEVIQVTDLNGYWKLSTPFSAKEFYDSAEFAKIRGFNFSLAGFSLALTFAGLAWLGIVRRKATAMDFRANHDDLTGLPNRRLLDARLKQAIAAAKTGKTGVVFYADLDRFKLINDTLGHLAGDQAIKIAADRLGTCIRSTDTLARVGGDEFVIVLTGNSDQKQLMFTAQRLIDEMALPMLIEGKEVISGTSLGIVCIDGAESDPNVLLRQADLALFRAKESERGSFRFYAPEMDAERERMRELEADLKLALAHNEFVLHYQPIVNVSTGETTGVEALIRWNHPKRGMIPPLDFIPLAEQSGAINKIGEWVLRQACQDVKLMPDHIKVAVNISAVQFSNVALPLQIVAALNAADLKPQRLELEMTESILMSNDGLAREMLTSLRKIGVRVALDDFGTGFSSLSYLKDFEFDKIKIDKSFLKKSIGDKNSTIVQAIASLSSSLGMTTTAEGVETIDQFNAISRQGCTEVQGYLFGKPLPMEDVLQNFGLSTSKRA